MCIIVIQPEDHVFDEYAIYDFYDHNPHGFGFMWIDDGGKLRGVKAVPKSAEHAIDMYFKVAAGVKGVLHYRFATSGLINTTMAHPFVVSKDLFVVHNGVLPGGDAQESDSYQFVKNVLKPLLGGNYRQLYNPLIQNKLEELLRGNSVVFLDKEGTITCLGNSGVMFEGCWYSNTYAWTLPYNWGDLDDDFM